MSIRLANTDDIPAIENLLEQILEVHHKARPDLFKAEGKKLDAAGLEALMTDETKRIFVYQDDTGRLLAHLFLSIEESKEEIFVPRKTLFIDDLCVDKAARGQHLGQAMLEHARKFAKEQGCYNLTLHVWNDNKGALRFYEREGFKPQYTVMEELL